MKSWVFFYRCPWSGPDWYIGIVADCLSDGSISVSTRLGHRGLRYLVKHSCGCVCVFLGEINIWIGRLRKAYIALPNAWPSSNQLNRTKKLTFPWWRGKLLLPDCWAGTLLFSWLWTWIETLALLRSPACWLLDWSLYPRLSCFSGLWIWPGLLPLVLLSLQLVNCRSYDFSASIITWVNSLLKKSLYMYICIFICIYISICILLVLFLWRSPTNTACNEKACKT